LDLTSLLLLYPVPSDDVLSADAEGFLSAPGESAEALLLRRTAVLDGVLEVNREAVRNAKQYHGALAKAKPVGKVLLRVRSEESTKLVLIPLPPK